MGSAEEPWEGGAVKDIVSQFAMQLTLAEKRELAAE